MPLLALLFWGGLVMAQQSKPIVLAIHGGAGVMERQKMSAESEAAYRLSLKTALDAGYEILESGGSALDAVQAAIVILEDNELFNAGKGAVFAASGKNELDASIMDGRGKAGAVAQLKHIRNPILLARAVMDHSGHVLLSGDGAEQFARLRGFEMVPESYFHSQRQYEEWQRQLQADAKPGKMGTVGCVALDRMGNLAAGTSTGGLTNKKFGRIGDSPLIGAGTYAENGVCAVSCTGQGEYFIRQVIGYDVAAQMKWGKRSLREAADYAIQQGLARTGGQGGLVSLSADGEVVFSFNTPGMHRGLRREGQTALVAIFQEETLP
jgi:beta-aspartyl-peptidase (threonine type)